MLGVSWTEQQAMPRSTLDSFIAIKERIKELRGARYGNPMRAMWDMPYDSRDRSGESN